MTNKLLRNSIITIIIVIALGIGLGFWYSQLPANNPQRDQESCEAAGGEWENETCLISNRATGEECTDGGQCQSGVCFPPDLTEDQLKTIESGNPVSGLTGTCHPEDDITGCIKQILNGTVTSESLCDE